MVHSGVAYFSYHFAQSTDDMVGLNTEVGANKSGGGSALPSPAHYFKLTTGVRTKTSSNFRWTLYLSIDYNGTRSKTKLAN